MSSFDEIDRLIDVETLPPDFRATVENYYAPIADILAERHKKAGRMLVAGLCGTQGSGKSTMALFLRALLRSLKLKCEILSIDDLYLTHAEREALARTVHPLLATRGPPGTHDVPLGLQLFSLLPLASPSSPVLLPRFDKATDDRVPVRECLSAEEMPDVLIFEGWCVDAKPQSEDALKEPINALERDQDKDGIWRRYVNARLAESYRTLFARIDHLIMLRPPSFECVYEWRLLQEEKLRKKAPKGTRVMSREEVARFIMHYERVSRHILSEMPGRADTVVDIGADHRLMSITRRAV